ncbi:chemotaxis protein [Paenibacillus sp. HJL G12]|uniref:Chemotaxis protein n=1 Tax=Paenibacillus dendrobii TaxID=2691084 RepID=A0A7X3IHF6_9BACL|nr:methyl-accepting chemotaxis protein [Paenibacillus dendrobii]MWV44007.1 chemotaxis protein [Paenibacillus dendrobii]
MSTLQMERSTSNNLQEPISEKNQNADPMLMDTAVSNVPGQQVSKISAAECCRTVPALNSSVTCREALGMLKEHPHFPCLVICGENHRPEGLLMKDAFFRRLTGRFAADLYFDRSVKKFAEEDILIVEMEEDPALMIRRALERPENRFYDCVIVTEKDRLAGVLTVQDLMKMSGLLQTEAEEQRRRTISENYGHVSGMEHSLGEVAEAASLTLEECLRMKEWTSEGRLKLDEAGQSYTEAVAHMNRNQKQVSRLIEDAGQISSLTQGIAKLADQSGLLAINASIEAAHAGSQGRGFQIVAAEVRSLAAQTRSLAADISGLLERISQLAAETGTLTASGVRQIQAGAEQLTQGSRMFGELEQAVGHVEKTGRSVHQLARDTAKQALGVKKELERTLT